MEKPKSKVQSGSHDSKGKSRVLTSRFQGKKDAASCTTSKTLNVKHQDKETSKNSGIDMSDDKPKPKLQSGSHDSKGKSRVLTSRGKGNKDVPSYSALKTLNVKHQYEETSKNSTLDMSDDNFNEDPFKGSPDEARAILQQRSKPRVTDKVPKQDRHRNNNARLVPSCTDMKFDINTLCENVFSKPNSVAARRKVSTSTLCENVSSKSKSTAAGREIGTKTLCENGTSKPRSSVEESENRSNTLCENITSKPKSSVAERKSRSNTLCENVTYKPKSTVAGRKISSKTLCENVTSKHKSSVAGRKIGTSTSCKNVTSKPGSTIAGRKISSNTEKEQNPKTNSKTTTPVNPSNEWDRKPKSMGNLKPVTERKMEMKKRNSIKSEMKENFVGAETDKEANSVSDTTGITEFTTFVGTDSVAGIPKSLPTSTVDKSQGEKDVPRFNTTPGIQWHIDLGEEASESGNQLYQDLRNEDLQKTSSLEPTDTAKGEDRPEQYKRSGKKATRKTTTALVSENNTASNSKRKVESVTGRKMGATKRKNQVKKVGAETSITSHNSESSAMFKGKKEVVARRKNEKASSNCKNKGKSSIGVEGKSVMTLNKERSGSSGSICKSAKIEQNKTWMHNGRKTATKSDSDRKITSKMKKNVGTTCPANKKTSTEGNMRETSRVDNSRQSQKRKNNNQKTAGNVREVAYTSGNSCKQAVGLKKKEMTKTERKKKGKSKSGTNICHSTTKTLEILPDSKTIDQDGGNICLIESTYMYKSLKDEIKISVIEKEILGKNIAFVHIYACVYGSVVQNMFIIITPRVMLCDAKTFFIALALMMLVIQNAMSNQSSCDVITVDLKTKSGKRKSKGFTGSTFNRSKTTCNNSLQPRDVDYDKEVGLKNLSFLFELQTICPVEIAVGAIPYTSLDCAVLHMMHNPHFRQVWSEWFRYSTLCLLPLGHDVPFALGRLSRQGLYYDSTTRRIVCYSCEGRRSVEELQTCISEDFRNLHIHTQHCRHIAGIEDRNIPIGDRLDQLPVPIQPRQPVTQASDVHTSSQVSSVNLGSTERLPDNGNLACGPRIAHQHSPPTRVTGPYTTTARESPGQGFVQELSVEEIRRLQEENESMRRTFTCKKCLERKVGLAFLPCGHLVCCYECGMRVKSEKGRCILCDEPIERVVPVFL